MHKQYFYLTPLSCLSLKCLSFPEIVLNNFLNKFEHPKFSKLTVVEPTFLFSKLIVLIYFKKDKIGVSKFNTATSLLTGFKSITNSLIPGVH